MDKKRTQFDVTLRLPAEHFLSFKPMVEMLMQMQQGKKPRSKKL